MGIGQGLDVEICDSLEELCLQSSVDGMVQAEDALRFSIRTFPCCNLGLCGIGSVHGGGAWVRRCWISDVSRHGFEDGRGFGENKMAVGTVSTIGVDGRGVGIEFSLEDEKGGMGRLADDRS